MNLKKLLILPVGFILTNGMYTACCNCKPVKLHHLQVQNFLVKPSGSKNTVVDAGATVYMDSLYLDGSFYVNCVASHTNPFSFLVNRSYACSCESCGDSGLQSPITSITITSNSNYNGIAAGSSLNQFFRTYNKYYSTYSPALSIDSMITLMNNNSRSVTSFNLFTQTKPANTSAHQLQLKTMFANGSIFTATTKDIVWQ